MTRFGTLYSIADGSNSLIDENKRCSVQQSWLAVLFRLSMTEVNDWAIDFKPISVEVFHNNKKTKDTSDGFFFVAWCIIWDSYLIAHNCCVCLYTSISLISIICDRIKSHINQSVGPENFLNSFHIDRMFIANLSHQILLKIVFWFLFVCFISESCSECIPESNDNMYAASTSRTSECTPLVVVRWNNS